LATCDAGAVLGGGAGWGGAGTDPVLSARLAGVLLSL